MNYARVYSEFIKDRKRINKLWFKKRPELMECKYNQRKKATRYLKDAVGYAECHHIKPKSLSGSDNADNLIYLSAEDHIHAHILLGAIHGGKQWAAIQYIMGNHKKYNHIPTRTMIKNASISIEKYRSSIIGSGHPLFGKVVSDETKQKLKDSWTDERKKKHSEFFKSEWKGKGNYIKALSIRMTENNPMEKEENRLKMVGENNHRYGVKSSNETREKISNANSGDKHHMYGKKHSIESRNKMSESAKGRKLTQSAKDKISGINSVSAVKCMCVNTGEIFISILEAAKAFDINHKTLGHCLRRKTGMKNGLNFVLV